MPDSPKTYLFDLYGVLIKDHGPAQFERVERAVGVPGKTELLHLIYEELRPAFDAGLVNEVSYWTQIQQRVGLPDLDIGEAIAADYQGLLEAHQDVIDFVLDLKKQGNRVGILSNIPPGLAKLVLAEHREWLDQLDAVNFSCDIAAAKPESKAFHVAVASLGVPAHEITFIDDRLRNVEAARREGLIAIHYTSLAQLKEQL